MNFIKLIENLINEHGSSLILRERLLLLKEEYTKAEKINMELVDELGQVKKENRHLKSELKKQRELEEFTEHRGALFKRKTPHGYHQAVFCPSCRIAMGNITDIAPFHCKPCGRLTSFKGNELPEILKELIS